MKKKPNEPSFNDSEILKILAMKYGNNYEYSDNNVPPEIAEVIKDYKKNLNINILCKECNTGYHIRPEKGKAVLVCPVCNRTVRFNNPISLNFHI